MITVFLPKGLNIRERLNARVSWFWLATANNSKKARIVNNDGDRNWNDPDKRNGAVRPDLLLKNRLPQFFFKIKGYGAKANSKKVVNENYAKWCDLVPKSKGISLLTIRLKCDG